MASKKDSEVQTSEDLIQEVNVGDVVNDRPVGRSKIAGQLPKWLVENRGLDALEKNKNTGQLYADHLCYFRCLARYRGCGLKNLERKTREFSRLPVADKIALQSTGLDRCSLSTGKRPQRSARSTQ